MRHRIKAGKVGSFCTWETWDVEWIGVTTKRQNAMRQDKFDKKQIWLFFPGDDKQNFDDMVDDNYVSIYEWGEIGSLNKEELRTQDGIRNALKEKVKEYKTKKPNHSVKMLYDMKHNMAIGDYLICRNKRN